MATCLSYKELINISMGYTACEREMAQFCHHYERVPSSNAPPHLQLAEFDKLAGVCFEIALLIQYALTMLTRYTPSILPSQNNIKPIQNTENWCLNISREEQLQSMAIE